MRIIWDIHDIKIPTCPIVKTNTGLRALIDTGAQSCIWYAGLPIICKDITHEYIGVSPNLLEGITGTSEPLYLIRSTIIINDTPLRCEFNYSPKLYKPKGVDVILGMSLFQNCYLTVDIPDKKILIDTGDSLGILKDKTNWRTKKPDLSEDIVLDRYILNAKSGKVQKR